MELFCSERRAVEMKKLRRRIFEKDSLRIERVKNGIICPCELAPSKKKMQCMDGFMLDTYYGGVVDRYFRLVELSDTIQGCGLPGCLHKGLFVGSKDKTIEISVNEPVVFIGALINCVISHFYLENLSRLWPLLDDNRFNKLKFAYSCYPYYSPSHFLLESIDFLLSCFKIPPENIIRVTRPTQFEEVIIPEASSELCWSWHKKYVELINKVKSSVPPKMHKKVYFTKVQNHTIGEDLAMEIFKNNGYEVFLPEQLSMKEKIAILNGCEDFVAQAESNGHNSIFLNNESKVTILTRGEYYRIVQFLIDQMKNLKTTYVEAHCALLPIWCSIGPFSFGYTEYLERYLTANNMIFDKEKLISQTHSSIAEYVKRWLGVYQNSEDRQFISARPIKVDSFFEIMTRLDPPPPPIPTHCFFNLRGEAKMLDYSVVSEALANKFRKMRFDA